MPLFRPPNVEKLKAKGNVKGLIKALRYEKDWHVREAAADALAKIGDERAVEPLAATLKDWQVREAAADALAKIGGERAVELLITALQSTSYDVRKAAAEVLGKIGDAQAVEPLIAASKDYDMRKTTVGALVKIGPPAVEPLITALQNADKYVRKAAAEVLGEIGDARAVDPLIAALEDEYYFVRAAVVWALKEIGDERAVEPLIATLKDASGYVREAAAKTLEEIGDERAVEPFIAALALVKIGPPSVKPLTTALEDENWSVVIRAAKALGRIGARLEDAAACGRAVESLIAALEAERKHQRRDAARALVEMYSSGKLNDAQERAILAQRSIITEKHVDEDRSPPLCADRPDRNGPHTDYGGIGVDFPI